MVGALRMKRITNRALLKTAWMVLFISSVCGAQTGQSAMPERLTIARHTFFDFGPPNDYYEVIQVATAGNGLSVQRALVTPAGDACFQPAKLEMSSGVVSGTMEELLASRNPCAIPERDLHREQKRCKKCLVFSGVDVTMQMSCGASDRQIRMDILDRDLFDSAPGTPKNTSWSMAVLTKLDKALGPGAMDKPIFPLDSSEPTTLPHSDLLYQILDGKFNSLFGEQTKVSEIAQEATKGPPAPPTIEIESVSPIAPDVSELPKYPPIAKLAHLEGIVEVSFDVDDGGGVQNIAFTNPPRLRMLQPAVAEALSKWNFPQPARGKSGKASIRFRLNCNRNPT
jgi:TonB family protein